MVPGPVGGSVRDLQPVSCGATVGGAGRGGAGRRAGRRGRAAREPADGVPRGRRRAGAAGARRRAVRGRAAGRPGRRGRAGGGAAGRGLPPVRPDGGPAAARHPVPAGRRRVGPLPGLPPHRHRRLVRRTARTRPLPRLRGPHPGPGPGVRAAAGPVPRLRRVAARVAGREQRPGEPRRPATRLLARRADRSAGGAGAAVRPLPPRGGQLHRRRRAVPAGRPGAPGPGRRRPGDQRDDADGAPGGSRRTAVPPRRRQRHPPRHRRGRTHRRGLGGPGRLLRQHPGAALGRLRRPDLRRAGGAGAADGPGRVRAPGRAVRAGGGGAQPGPLAGPAPALPGGLRRPRDRWPGAGPRGRARHPGGAAGHRDGQVRPGLPVRPDEGRHRRRRRHRGNDRVRRGPVRPGDGADPGRPAGALPGRAGRGSGDAGVRCRDPGGGRAAPAAGDVERQRGGGVAGGVQPAGALRRAGREDPRRDRRLRRRRGAGTDLRPARRPLQPTGAAPGRTRRRPRDARRRADGAHRRGRRRHPRHRQGRRRLRPPAQRLPARAPPVDHRHRSRPRPPRRPRQGHRPHPHRPHRPHRRRRRPPGRRLPRRRPHPQRTPAARLRDVHLRFHRPAQGRRRHPPRRRRTRHGPDVRRQRPPARPDGRAVRLRPLDLRHLGAPPQRRHHRRRPRGQPRSGHPAPAPPRRTGHRTRPHRRPLPGRRRRGPRGLRHRPGGPHRRRRHLPRRRPARPRPLPRHQCPHPVRPDRDHALRDPAHGVPRRAVQQHHSGGTAAGQHADVHSGRVVAPGAGGRVRRALPGRRGSGPRLPGPGRPHRRAVRGERLRGAGFADVPHRRPGPLDPQRRTRLRRPGRRPGQDPRLPDRTGRDRDGPGRRRPGGPVRGTGPGGARRREAPGGLRRTDPRRRLGRTGTGRRPRQVGRATARVHGPRRVRGPAGPATDPQRKTGRTGTAQGGVHRHDRLPAPARRPRGDPVHRLRRNARHRTGRPRRRLLRPGRPLPAGHPTGQPDPHGTRRRGLHPDAVRGPDRRRPGRETAPRR